MADQQRSEFVLSTTISELILLLFFLLLLLVGYVYHRLDAKSKELSNFQTALVKAQKEREALELAIKSLETLVKLPPDDERRSVLVSLEKAEAILAQRQAELDEVQARVATIRQLLERLKKEGASFAKVPPHDIQQWSDVEICKRGAHAPKLSRELADANKRNAELTQRVKQCGGKGEEFVACWRGSDGKIQFIYQLTLSASGIRVESRWPEERTADMAAFGAERELVGKTVGLEQFLSSTSGLFQDSVSKSCRHYVVIAGKRSEMNPAMFRDYRGIQGHFYHLSAIN